MAEQGDTLTLETTKGPVASWTDRFREWLDARGFLKP